MSWDWGAFSAKVKKLVDSAIDLDLSHYHSIVKDTDGLYYYVDGTTKLTPNPEIMNDVFNKYQEIYTIFSDWQYFPVVENFTGPIGDCEKAMYQVSAQHYDDPVGHASVPDVNNELSQTILPTASRLTEWDGLAASSFVDNVAVPFAGRMDNMFTAIAALRGAYVAESAIWEVVPKRLNDIVDQAQHAIDNCFECSADDWGLVVDVCNLLAVVPIPVVNVVATVAAGAAAGQQQKAGDPEPSGTDKANKKGEVVSKACSVVTSVTDAVGKGQQLAKDADKSGDADTPGDVLNQLRDGVNDLSKSINTAESKIRDGMVSALKMLTQYYSDFVPGRPNLIDASHEPDLLGNPNQSARSEVTWA